MTVGHLIWGPRIPHMMAIVITQQYNINITLFHDPMTSWDIFHVKNKHWVMAM